MFFETSWGLEGLGAAYVRPDGTIGGQGDPLPPNEEEGTYWELPVGSGSERGGTNTPKGQRPPGPDILYFNCSPEWVAKYKAKYGVAPTGCGKPIPPEAIGTIYPERQKRPVPTYILPPTTRGPGYTPPPTIVIEGPQACSYPPPPAGREYIRGPNYDPRTNCGLILSTIPSAVQPTGGTSTPPATIQPRQRVRPRRRQPIALPPAPEPTGPICPVEGYVTRPLPGTKEYGIFPCRRGQPVVIDPNRMAQLTAQARARGLSDFDEILAFVQQPTFGLPMWAWLVVTAAIFMMLRRGRR